MKNLYLVSNDKIWSSKNFFTSNNDLDTIISCLVKNFNIKLMNRRSKKNLKFKINNKFDFCYLKNIQEKKINLLMISISPYNFFILLKLIFLLNKDVKGYVYLRSDGYLEYKIRYGFLIYYYSMMDLLETISTYGKSGRVTLIKIVTHSQHHPKLSTIHVH